MKKYINKLRIYSKTLYIILLSIFFSISILSCLNAAGESKDNNGLNQINTASDSNTGTITIRVLTKENKKSRTALAGMDINKLTNLTLSGTLNGNTKTLGNWDTINELQNKSFTLETETWELNLTASYDGFTFSDTRSVPVSLNSSQEVAFELSSENTSGGISLKISFSSDKTCDHAKYDLYRFYSSETTSLIATGSLTIKTSDTEKYIEFTRNSSNALDSGTYHIVFTFYGDESENLILNTYSEIIHVKGGFISGSTTPRFINLNEVFTIFYENKEDGVPVSGESLIEKYSINSDYSTITFPDLVRENYKFLGWYTLATGGQKVESLPTGSSGDQHFYARWKKYPELTYKIVNYFNDIYDVSDTLRESYNLPARHNPDEATDLTVYNITDGETTTKIPCTFWFDTDCSSEQISGGIISATQISEDKIIYIKPEIDHVYLYPSNGNDTYLAFNVNTPVKSVEVAENWVGYDSSKIIYLKSAIKLKSDVEKASGGAIIKRHSSAKELYLFDLATYSVSNQYGEVSLSDVTIDGGAVFGSVAANSSVYNYANTGINSSKPLIYLGNNAKLTLSNVVLQNNISSTFSGAITIDSSILEMTDCTITKCKGKQGGAVYINQASTLTMTQCQILNNAATNKGGALYFHSNDTRANLTNVNFNANASIDGGAIFIDQSSGLCTIENCTFTNNTVTSGNGNVIYDKGSTASTAGSNLYLKGNISIDSGDIYTDVVTPIMLHTETKATGSVNPIILTPLSYGSAPAYNKQILDFTNVASANISSVKAYFTLGGTGAGDYIIDNAGYIKPIPGSITVIPGFPGTYSCKYTLTKNGSTRTINIILKDSDGASVNTGLIESLKVTLYEAGDAIKTWPPENGTIADALEFTYPGYLDDPSDTSFYVEVSIKPAANASVAYSFDFIAECY